MSKYRKEHCEKLIDLMTKGYLNLEIAAKFNIAEKTFYDWKERYPEFGEAFEIGYPKQFMWWMTKGREKYLDGENDKGYKYWHAVMRNCFNYDAGEGKGNTTIQIGNMNVLNQKSDTELLQLLQDKLNNLKLPDTNIIPVLTEYSIDQIQDRHDET